MLSYAASVLHAGIDRHYQKQKDLSKGFLDLRAWQAARIKATNDSIPDGNKL